MDREDNKMDKVVFFKNDDYRTDYCCGQIYYDFLDYAFSQTDFFMLVYSNKKKKGYSSIMKHFKDALRQYKVKSRTNASWAGTLGRIDPVYDYTVIFYRTDPAAKEILKEVDRLSAWSCPSYPEDLSFFKGNQCWAYSVGHEIIQGIIHANKQDIDFVVKHGLADYSDVTPYDSFYDDFDEILIKNS